MLNKKREELDVKIITLEKEKIPLVYIGDDKIKILKEK